MAAGDAPRAPTAEERLKTWLDVAAAAIGVLAMVDVFTGGEVRRFIDVMWATVNRRPEEPKWTPGAEAVIARAESILKEAAEGEA